mmetsp:Transcript_16323/g.18922  ORF Transcript_16323/g.18922 Transcript_16323/m.18922 type:complete len:360 (+) Transcript_16323:47-1126(+)
MAPKGTKKKKQRRKQKQNAAKKNTCDSNFFTQAGPGCHIVRFKSDSKKSCHCENHLNNSDNTEIIEWDQEIHKEDYEGDEVTDLVVDPEEKTLTLCNIDQYTKVAYITIFEADCYGKHHKKFSPGTTTDNDGNTFSCVTFIVLSPPMTFCTLCEIDLQDITNVRLESDVQEWTIHPNPELKYVTPLQGFPLLGGPFLCTQGIGGHLTHYFLGNLHAIDFRCEVCTPLLAVEDGIVAEVIDGNTLSGIAVSNLFKWNSILIRHEVESDDPIYTEYVHIQSAHVQKGDKVMKGDIIGLSGSIGFSPEPHLHFAVYRSNDVYAPTVGFYFKGTNGQVYQPVAGKYYSANGSCNINKSYLIPG